ncbi:MAG: cytochrome c oxidase subunit 3 [Candidatus Omnitrophica bacterium]|nr:cytochrome c oxidase subunit 3 [Candidatus Omnitrophota bacterium]
MLSSSLDAAELRQRNTFSIGVMIALSSWALIFMTLLWGYVAFRLRAVVWWQGALTPSAQTIGIINTLIIAASSWCLSRLRSEHVRRAGQWAWAAFLLGVCFLAGQSILWQQLLQHGLHWQKSAAGGMFFLLTGFHALHIVGGLIAIFLLCLRHVQWQGTFKMAGIKYFWDFLLAVWLVMFVLIFIVQ